MPNDYSKSGDTFLNRNGEKVDGVTRYLGSGNRKSDVYLAKNAFQSKDALYLVMGHEYIHVNLNYGGFFESPYSQERVAYEWSIEQGQKWNMDVRKYQFRYKQDYWRVQNPEFFYKQSSIRKIRPW